MSCMPFIHHIDDLFRGRHASKITEEEEDEEYLKEEEDALSGAGGTRLVSQPSCEILLSPWKIFYNSRSVFIFPQCSRHDLICKISSSSVCLFRVITILLNFDVLPGEISILGFDLSIKFMLSLLYNISFF